MEKFKLESFCLPVRFKSFLNLIPEFDSKIKLCNTWKEEIENTAIVWRFQMEIMNSCPTSCIQYQYRGEMSSWKGFTEDPNKIEIFYLFPTNRVQIFEEYLMFEFNDLIGTIGGHSGLFIGFSFYGFISEMIQYIQSKLQSS